MKLQKKLLVSEHLRRRLLMMRRDKFRLLKRRLLLQVSR
jgi:hypothetical protein